VPANITAANLETPPSSFLQWGRVKLHPYLSYSLVYSEGLQAQPGQPANSVVHNFTVGSQMDLTDHWTGAYVATFSLYSNRRFQDSTSQAINLAGGTTYGDWLLGFSQAYATSSAPRIETGRQTDVQNTATSFSASRRLGDKLSLELSVAQSLQFVSNSPDTYDWSTSDFMRYRFSTRFDAGVGIALGYTDTDPGSHMTYVNPQASFQWSPTDKISWSVQGGSETRKFHRGGVSDLKSPTVGTTIHYQPFKYTALSFTVSRNVTTSILANQVVKGQTWAVSLDQRLLQHFNLSLSVTGQKSSYVATIPVLIPDFVEEEVTDSEGNVSVVLVPSATLGLVSVPRQDQTHSYSARLSTALFGRVAVGLSYEETRNSSNSKGFGIQSRQTGLDIGYRF
jgi:hypothetical protein